MDKSPRSASPYSTSDRSYASVAGSPPHNHNETGDDKGSTSSLQPGKLTLKLKASDNGQTLHASLRDKKLRQPTPPTTGYQSSQVGNKDGQNLAHGSQHSSPATTARIQRVQTRVLTPVHQPGTSQKGPAKDSQVVANQNAQIASMQATIGMLQDDLSRRTSELIEAKTTIVYRDSSIDELNNVIETLQAEKFEFASLVNQENQENQQTIIDLRRENEGLRSAIHTGIISIAHVYGPETSQAFTRVAEEAANRAAIGQTPSELSLASPRELSPKLSPKPSPECTPAVPASVSSSCTLQTRILTGDSSQPHSTNNCRPLTTGEEPKVTGDGSESLDETARLAVASEVHEHQEAEESQNIQESQSPQESCETKKSQPNEDFNRQPTQDDDATPSANAESVVVNIPPVSPKAANASAKISDEVRDSPASLTPSLGHPAADSPAAELPKVHPPTTRPRSYATVAKYDPVTPRKKGESKPVSSPQVGKGTPRTPKSGRSVSSGESVKIDWRARAMEERAGKSEQAASSNMTDRPAPGPSGARFGSLSATKVSQTWSYSPQPTKKTSTQSKDQLAEKEEGWESVKPKYKPKKKNKKPKGPAQTQAHPANPVTTGISTKATPKESNNIPMPTKPVLKENRVQPQSQQKWKKQTGTVIGSNSVFSQAADKQKENQSSPVPQDSSHGRNVSNSGVGSQLSSPGVQSKPPPKKPADTRVNSCEKKLDWAEEVEEEYSQKNPDNIVHSSN
ncbi:hypothetical protein Hte_007189 [Hypoxylon texense]